MKIANASLERSASLVFTCNEVTNWTHCSCIGVCQIRPKIWPKPNLAEFGKIGRISAWPKPKPKFGATLGITCVYPQCTLLCCTVVWHGVMICLLESWSVFRVDSLLFSCHVIIYDKLLTHWPCHGAVTCNLVHSSLVHSSLVQYNLVITNAELTVGPDYWQCRCHL